MLKITTTGIDMTTEGAIKYFRNGIRLARLLGLKEQAVYNWGKYPPELRQRQLAELSDGVLVVEPGITLKPIIEDYS
jgi:hypothetical protein